MATEHSRSLISHSPPPILLANFEKSNILNRYGASKSFIIISIDSCVRKYCSCYFVSFV